MIKPPIFAKYLDLKSNHDASVDISTELCWIQSNVLVDVVMKVRENNYGMVIMVVASVGLCVDACVLGNG